MLTVKFLKRKTKVIAGLCYCYAIQPQAPRAGEKTSDTPPPEFGGGNRIDDKDIPNICNKN